MTTSEDLRLALNRAVADPPPMSPGLLDAIEGRHVQRRRRRTGFMIGIVVAGAAAAAVAAWSMHTPDSKRTGLERYNPAAIEQARRDRGAASPLPDSNGQVTIVMEVRYVCQNVYRYLDDPTADEAVELRRRLRSSDAVAGNKIRALTDLVRSNLTKDEGNRSTAGLAELASSECPSRDHLTEPIRRGGP
jgi:hypothetical protein